jgi:uncharacterized Rossmann fold enzyme
MRDGTIVVSNYGNHLITVARSAPVEIKIIVKQVGDTIETLSQLKQKGTDVLGTTPTVPNVAPAVGFY